MTGLWLPNLKKFMTGTLNGSKYSLDVHVANTVATAAASFAYKEHRLHDAGSTTINGSGGAFVRLGAVADLADTITELRIRNHAGAAIVVAAGADATAAAAATPLAVVHEGGEENFGVALVSGQKIWIRAMEAADITSGKILGIFTG